MPSTSLKILYTYYLCVTAVPSLCRGMLNFEDLRVMLSKLADKITGIEIINRKHQFNRLSGPKMCTEAP